MNKKLNIFNSPRVKLCQFFNNSGKNLYLNNLKCSLTIVEQFVNKIPSNDCWQVHANVALGQSTSFHSYVNELIFFSKTSMRVSKMHSFLYTVWKVLLTEKFFFSTFSKFSNCTTPYSKCLIAWLLMTSSVFCLL